MKRSLFTENILIALDSIKSHMVRSILTVLIIAFGIMALVGILTSIDAIKYYLNDNFALLGANTFSIQNRNVQVHMGNRQNAARNNSAITFNEAMQFKNSYTFPATASVNVNATGLATVKYGSEETNPNINVKGVDENYLLTSGYELELGRNITANEAYYGSPVVILGSSVRGKLFGTSIQPIDEYVRIGSVRYQVIGVLKAKGSTMGMNPDNICLLPLNTVRTAYSRPNMNFPIQVVVSDQEQLDAAIGEATGLFRTIRKDITGYDDSFEITKSDNLSKMLFDNLKYLRLAATLIGIITLLGAAIGLMNIMLVSVTERTREIGIRMATGATRKTIKHQFLTEAIVIGQIGGLVGIFFGIVIGNILAMVIGAEFIIPWVWIIAGVLICFVVAVASGYIPANKASKLDPVDSLRYE